MSSDAFTRIGRRLFAEHLVIGNFGNISIKVRDEGFLIKRAGAFLDEAGDPVYVPLCGEVPKEASSEFRVHRTVYLRTEHLAIVHAHPPFAIAASLVLDEIVPFDVEGQMFCPRIVVTGGAPGSDEIAGNVAESLIQNPIVFVRGHGTFAAGKTLDEAFQFTSLAEHSCRVLALRNQFI